MAILNSTTVNGQLEANALNVKGKSGSLALYVSGNALVKGDLEVQGDLVYVGTKDIRVEDKTIELAYRTGSAVTREQADGAGVIIGKSGSAEIASILYKYAGAETEASEDRIVPSHKISGSITDADHANAAAKVDNALVFGDGITADKTSYDGHEAVTISVDTSSLKPDAAKHADSASKVDHSLTIKGDGLAAEIVFDGSEAKTASLDLSAYEKVADFNTYTASQATINANLLASASAAESASKAYASSSLASYSASQASVNVTISASVATEASRSKAAELEISKSVATEVSRSEAAELVLSQSIATEASRSLAAEKVLSGSIATEKGRAETAEANLTTAISDEEARAKAAEAGLASDIVASASAATTYTDTKIAALDYADTASAGKYVSKVDEVDGVIAVTRADIPVMGVSGSEKIISLDDDRNIKTTLSLNYVTDASASNFGYIQIKGIDGAVVSEIELASKFVKDSVLFGQKLFKATAESQEVEVKRGTETQKITLTGLTVGHQYLAMCFKNTDAKGKTTYEWEKLDVTDLVDVYTAGDGLALANNKFSVKVDTASEAFLSVSADGVKVSGVQSAINAASKSAKDYADELIAGLDSEKSGSNASNQIEVKVKEVDGKLDSVVVTAEKFDLDGAAEAAAVRAIASGSASLATYSGSQVIVNANLEASASKSLADAKEYAKPAVDYVAASSSLLDTVKTKVVSASGSWDNAATWVSTNGGNVIASASSAKDAKDWIDANKANLAATASWNAAATWVGANSASYHSASWDAAATWVGDHSASVAVLETSASLWNGRLDNVEATASANSASIASIEADFMKKDGSNSMIAATGLAFQGATAGTASAHVKYVAASNEFQFVFEK